MPRGMRVAGVMSGTSSDAVDVALVEIHGLRKNGIHLAGFYSQPYAPRQRRAILSACNAAAISVAELARLDFWLGECMAQAVRSACRRARWPLTRLDLIAAHGPTIYHQAQPRPYLGRAISATWQWGEAAVIAARTGVPVVGNFRAADLALGGQGAPLVPWLDYLWLRDARRSRAALNIGGIANLTYLPAGGRADQVLAFDTGPGNMVLDALAAHYSRGRLRCDRGGAWAGRGQVHADWLRQLLRHPFFQRLPPKSCGREQFGAAYVQQLLRFAQRRRMAEADVLATATALTAQTIVRGLRQVCKADAAAPAALEMIASGGGIHNRTLWAMLAQAAPQWRWKISDDFGLPSQAKEAVAFALLGYAHRHGIPGNLPRVTGAGRPAILGQLQPVP